MGAGDMQLCTASCTIHTNISLVGLRLELSYNVRLAYARHLSNSISASSLSPLLSHAKRFTGVGPGNLCEKRVTSRTCGFFGAHNVTCAVLVRSKLVRLLFYLHPCWSEQSHMGHISAFDAYGKAARREGEMTNEED